MNLEEIIIFYPLDLKYNFWVNIYEVYKISDNNPIDRTPNNRFEKIESNNIFTIISVVFSF